MMGYKVKPGKSKDITSEYMGKVNKGAAKHVGEGLPKGVIKGDSNMPKKNTSGCM